MKHTITTLLLLLTILMPHTPLFAAETGSQERQDLQAQLEAVQTYLNNLTTAPQTLSDDELREAILEGTDWLITAQEENGHFAYEYAPYEDTYLRGDNIVRQGGALYALGEVYRRQVKKDVDTERAIKKAITFFEDQSITVEDDGMTFRCVANTPTSNQCKLGATSLVLIGILGYIEGKPSAKDAYQDLIDDYTAYILAAQKSEGGFSNTLKNGEFDEAESPFSNGEALLALVRVYQAQSNPRIKLTIDRTFEYLKTKEYDNSLYLWIIAALKDMQTLWPNAEYVTYTRNFTAWRIAGGPSKNTEHNFCPYAEGLASAYSVLATMPQNGELNSLRREIDRLNARHKTLQITGGNLYRVVGNADGTFQIAHLAEPQLARGGFLTGNAVPTQRIDFTQHCVSAYAQTLVEIYGQSL